jgi:hypothetical protein
MGEVLLVCSFIVFIMLLIFVKKQQNIKKTSLYPRRSNSCLQTTMDKRISRFSRDDSALKNYTARSRDKYHSVESPRQVIGKDNQKYYVYDGMSNYNYNILNFYTPNALTDTLNKDQQLVKKNSPSEFKCVSAIKNEAVNNAVSSSNNYFPSASVTNTNIVNNQMKYNVMRLSDFIREEDKVRRDAKMIDSKNKMNIIDLEDISHSLSKFHNFNNNAKMVLENKLNSITIQTPFKEDDLLKEIVPKKIDFSTISEKRDCNESFSSFKVATGMSANNENKENLNKN